ncbi:unnamed protein product [Cylicostephanus goldi]|uniref:ALIX V-shaped domain-containing protein n=1 Tax=Cylicostephanus goldi TaxID=71465 RepID=A0A3P6SGL3_CYLGO|nr:unnamed protein product [Cylicostephanus goldi]
MLIQVRSAGGLKELQAKLNEVTNLRARIKEILADIERTLGNESRSDAELRQRLGVNCHRIASNGLTEPFLKEMAKARTALTSTLEEDKISKKKFGENWQSIETLSKPEKELYALFPPRPNRLGDKTPEAMSFLLKLLDKAQEIKCERVELLKEINAKRTSTPVDDMIPIISQSKFCSDDTIIKEKLKEICDPIKEEVDKSLKKQTTLMNDVEVILFRKTLREFF